MGTKRDIEKAEGNRAIKKAIASEAGVTLLETIIALAVFAIIFSVLFSTLNHLTKVIQLNTLEVKTSQQLWEKTAICTRDIWQSDVVKLERNGQRIVLSNSRTGGLIIYELVKSSNKKKSYNLVKKLKYNLDGVIVLRELLPPPESKFTLVQRQTGAPMVQVKFAVQKQGMVLRKSAWSHPRGLL